MFGTRAEYLGASSSGLTFCLVFTLGPTESKLGSKYKWGQFRVGEIANEEDFAKCGGACRIRVFDAG
jgi:hypothetical protein